MATEDCLCDCGFLQAMVHLYGEGSNSRRPKSRTATNSHPGLWPKVQAAASPATAVQARAVRAPVHASAAEAVAVRATALAQPGLWPKVAEPVVASTVEATAEGMDDLDPPVQGWSRALAAATARPPAPRLTSL